MEEISISNQSMNTPESAIVRIFNTHGYAIGSGFLVSANLIVTCAHVVQSALGTNGPDDVLQMDLPLIAAGAYFSGKVVFQDKEKDISCIELNQSLPGNAKPVSLVSTDSLWGHSFRVFGFPQGHENGVWASGVIRGFTAEGWLQIEDVKAAGFGIQPGFSGGLVWDDQLKIVVGMVVAAETDVSIKAAYCIPAQVLARAYPPLSDYVIEKRAGGRTSRASPQHTTTRRRMFMIVIGLIVALYTPWVYNHKFYRVPRPILSETCQPSRKPIRVAVAGLTQCSLGTRTKLIESWKNKSNLADVTTLSEGFRTSEEARSDGDRYDMVVWGECKESDENILDLKFELITSRSPIEVYEPHTFHAMGDSTSLTETSSALFDYQSGNYVRAAKLFDALIGKVISDELLLFKANSWLFGGKYDLATSFYNEILQPSYPYSAAVNNNLGVALNNKDLSLHKDTRLQGLTEFSRAIELASNNANDIHNIDIKSIALYNRSLKYIDAGQWNDALNDCESAQVSNADSALPYICLANYSLDYYRFTPLNLPGFLPLNTINLYLTEAEEKKAPPVVHFLRAMWYSDHFWTQKQNAVDQYTLYISGMEHQACLSTDSLMIGDANYFIDLYTK